MVDSHCCEICFEEFPISFGILCGNGHFLCLSDLNPYLMENIFPYLHKLRKNKCAIECPVIGCHCVYNPIQIFSIIGINERARYLSIIKSISESDSTIIRIRNTFQDILTLNCPTCYRPVDPFPDACSAVMCLNCGNFYCKSSWIFSCSLLTAAVLLPNRSNIPVGNYCFQGFATGNSDEDRAASHTHSALHHPSQDPTKRDAFLPLDIIKVGQLERQQSQLVQCVALAMTSKEFAKDNRRDIALSLIMLHMELSDMHTTASEIWTRAEISITAPTAGRHMGANDHSLERSNIQFEERNETTERLNAPPSYDPNPAAAAAAAAETGTVDHSGAAQLANALKQQNPHAVRQILQAFRNDLDINYVEPQNLYPLTSLAILSKQKDVALLLIRRGADPTLMSRQGRSVFYLVIEAGYLDLLTILLEKHPLLDVNMIINSEGDNYTMLHTAVRFNQGHIVQFLTTRPGINLNLVESEFQYTPLMLAVVKNYKWSIDVLLNAGADITIPARNGRTPLYVAIEKSQISTFQTLISVQAETFPSPSSPSSSGINQPVCITHGSCPLHVAALHNKLEMIEFLIASGAEIDQLDSHGCTALYRALVHEHGAIAYELLKAGADPKRSSPVGRSALYLAIEKNLLQVVRMLLTDFRLPINEPTSAENIDSLPISVALIYRCHDILHLLIELGADVNQPESVNENTPLATAICLDDYWAVNFLLQHQADPCLPVSNGRLPLYVAIEKGNTEIIRLLLSDPRVNIHDSVSPLEEKPLHVAVAWQQADAISTLLELGADELVQDGRGQTPLDLAKELSSAASSSSSLLQIFHYYRQRRE
jgi:ankyrin repeat protein